MKTIALSADEDVAEASDKDNHSSSFSSRLVRRIIENLQIEVADVHVSLKDMDGAAGVVLDSLSLITTDANGHKAFVDRTAADKNSSIQNSFLYKKLDINGFGLYLDDATSIRHLLSINEDDNDDDSSSNNNKDGRGNNATADKSHRYILKPLSFQANLRQADSNVCLEHHKYLLSSQLSSIVVNLGRDQADLARSIVRKLQPQGGSGIVPLFPEYRPLCRVTKDTAKEWWMYAGRCVGRLTGRRLWPEFFRAFKIRKKYIPLYKRHAHHKTCPWIDALSKEEASELKTIELDRSISTEGIMIWRNIADAQMEKEKEKHNAKQPAPSKGIFSSIFGSGKDKNTDSVPSLVDDPPIELSVEELKELESIGRQEIDEEDLSQDSKLCDLQFVLKSLKVNLFAYNTKKIAALEMGSVSTAFSANMDGAFQFDFKISDLMMNDHSTHHTLFPSILRRTPYKTDKEQFKSTSAFIFHADKAHDGDQQLTIKLDAFEAIASPSLVKEVHAFLTPPQSLMTQSQVRQNPLLAQSLSGSVDLFFDATPGVEPDSLRSLGNSDVVRQSKAQDTTADEWTSALVDAWQQKVEKKASWTVDIDIMAPVLVVPESCANPRSSILVFDLGRLRLQYGKIDPSPAVADWFRRTRPSSADEAVVDGGDLHVSDLKFFADTVSSWQKQTESRTTAQGSHVIRPITLRLDLGIENQVGASTPRVCALGVIPSIGVNLSPKSGSHMATVAKTWSALLSDITDTDNDDGGPSVSTKTDSQITSSRTSRPGGSDATDRPSQPSAHPATAVVPSLHIALEYEEVVATVLDEEGSPQIQAKLASLKAMATSFSDSSVESRLQMGYFWLLDHLKGDYVRKQRLIAHSSLSPATAADEPVVATSLRYLNDVDRNGDQTTELADILFKVKTVQDGSTQHQESTLRAKFSSLYIHWNPTAMKHLVQYGEEFQKLLIVDNGSGGDSVIVLPNNMKMRAEMTEKAPSVVSSSNFHITAEMRSFNIYLNSALDDLPLFILSLQKTRADFDSSASGRDTMVGLSLGDLKVVTNNQGDTLPDYETLLGMQPNKADSILSVQFFTGSKIPKSDATDNIIGENTESFAQVTISPVRLVFLQAQVMALTEYITEGILGAVAAQAATSATEAAMELATYGQMDKIFLIHAQASDIVLPESATSSEYLSIDSGEVMVCYKILPQPNGATAQIRLKDVALRDKSNSMLQESPICATVGVILPDDSVGDLDDQAMRVAVNISDAKFKISRPQYQHIMSTLSKNLGDTDLHLRDVSSLEAQDSSSRNSSGSIEDGEGKPISHAGVAVVEKTQRLVLTAKIKELSLELLSDDPSSSLVSIAAVDTQIKAWQYPDLDKQVSEVVLRNLICRDTRKIAQKRQFQHLMKQGDVVSPTNDDSDTVKDLFRLKYTNEIGSSDMELFIGSPQMTLIPDAVSGILNFFKDDYPQNAIRKTAGSASNSTYASLPVAKLTDRSDDKGRLVPASDIPDVEEDAPNLMVSHAKIRTNECSILLVDLGSQLYSDDEMKLDDEQAGEVIVVQGIFTCNFSTTTDLVTNQQTDAQVEVNGDSMQVYTAFGNELQNKTQIMDPIGVSAHLSLESNVGEIRHIELRAATLSHVDIIFSMHDAALLNSILSSTQDFFAENMDTNNTDSAQGHKLNAAETERIENLAQVLENADGVNDQLSQEETASASRSSISSPCAPDQESASTTKYMVKMTVSSAQLTVVNDLQGLDEALFRIGTRNFVAKGDVLMKDSAPAIAGNFNTGPLFDVHMNSSILADYFDTTTGRWTQLLTEPWEVSLKANRSPNSRFPTKRLSTVIDLESFPCKVSLSDRFLVSLASANQMWTVYSSLVNGHGDIPNQSTAILEDPGIQRSVVSSVARNLVTSLPYAIDNQTGFDIAFTISGDETRTLRCTSGNIHYFRFSPPQETGRGGKRQYGQDVTYKKLIDFEIMGHRFQMDDPATTVGDSWQAHELGNALVVYSRVETFGKTMLMHITSCIEVKNSTMIPFRISVRKEKEVQYVGTSVPRYSAESKSRRSQSVSINTREPVVPSPSFSIPAALLDTFTQSFYSGQESDAHIEIQPVVEGVEGLTGNLQISTCLNKLKASRQPSTSVMLDVICKTKEAGNQKYSDPFVLQAMLSYTLIDNKFTSICIELFPRAIIQNKLPLKIHVRTPMPHTYVSNGTSTRQGDHRVFTIDQDDDVEIFTPGPSIAITTKPAAVQIGGTALDWMDGGWVDLPLVSEFQLPEPLGCLFPFTTNQGRQPTPQYALGNDFFIVEGLDMLRSLPEMCSADKFQTETSNRDHTLAESSRSVHAFFITGCNYAVDHTGDLLFEQVDEEAMTRRRRSSIAVGSKKNRSSWTGEQEAKPFGAFSSEKYDHRITMLPNVHSAAIRLLQLTMNYIDGMQRSMPFRIEDVPISSGGVDSLSVPWEDADPSGYFAYRKLIDEHQCEVHFIPEFFVYNGSTSAVMVHEANLPEIIVEADKAVPLRVRSRPNGIQLAFNFVDIGCCTAYMTVTDLGMKVALVKSRDGYPVGSVAIQTVIDTLGNACLVIKIGQVKYGTKLIGPAAADTNFLKHDFVRYRVRWTSLVVTLNKKATLEELSSKPAAPQRRTVDLARSKDMVSPQKSTLRKPSTVLRQQEPVATITLNRFTVDYQRIFDERKQTDGTSTGKGKGKERTQISVIAHQVQIKDEDPNSSYPIVLGCSDKVSFLDLCIRARGSLNADIVRVDLFDLNLAHINGSTEKIVVNTDEGFVWKLLDVVNQIATAGDELEDMAWTLEKDEASGSYAVRIGRAKALASARYTPPTTDQLYNIQHTRVSPFTLLVSFKRNPEASRYRDAMNSRGGAIVKYFTQRLKFQIDKAELKFARYSDHSLRGPPDRIVESLLAVYMSRMKYKALKLLTATSIQDWRYLASRDNGDDEYVEGDILRATGHLSGKTIGYVFKKASSGIGNGISGVTRAIGNGIETSSESVGVGRLGGGVNSVVSGVGDGIGSTIKGIGNGVGMALKGGGQGLGQMVGGVTGGVLMAGKGIGKGVVSGDSKGMVKGFQQGGKSIGDGVGQGVQSAVMGTADGVMTLGRGVFAGINSVGKGFGGAVRGDTARRDSKTRRSSQGR